MRPALPLLAALTALLAPLRAADGNADNQAVRDVAERVIAAYAAKDLDAFTALWSEKSPELDLRKRDAQNVFAETGPIRVKSVEVVWARRDGDAAQVRVRAELMGDDAKTGQPHTALGPWNGVLDLVRETGRWKVTSVASAPRALLNSLTVADSKAARLRLLDDDADLVGPDLVDMLLREGESQAEQRRFASASQIQEVAFEVAGGLGDKAALGWCWLYRGRSLNTQARYEPALSAYLAALRLCREANHREGEGNALNRLGVVYEEMGRYGEALQAYQDSIKIKRDLGDRAGEAASLNNMGVVYDETGLYAEALRQYRDALTIMRDLSDRAGEATTLNNIGNVYRDKARYAERLQHQDGATRSRVAKEVRDLYAAALQQYQDSLKIKRDLEDHAGEAQSLNNIAVVYNETDRYAEALQQYQDALKVMRDLEDYAEAASTLNNIGTIYLAMRQYADARRRFEEGLRIAVSIDDPVLAALCHGNLGRVYQDQKDWREAAQAYREAIHFTERLRTNTREPSLQSSLLAQKCEPFFRLAQCLLELRQPAEAFSVSEGMKARGLVDILQQGKADLRRGMSDDERKEEQGLQHHLTELGVQRENLQSRHADKDVQDAVQRDLTKARQELDAFRRDLYLHRPDLATRRAEFAPAAPDDLNHTLFAGRPGLAVLSYLVGDKETLLFVLRPGEQADGPARLWVHRIDVGADALAEEMGEARDACSDPSKAETESNKLYGWLIDSAADELAGAKQLVIIPDGVLHTLPFQALKASDGAYLIERFAVSYAPSVTALAKMEEEGAKRRKQYAGRPPSLLAVGITDFGYREKTLPSAEQEARVVADSFGDGAKLLSGTEATLSKVEASWSGRRYLHFATHGRLNSDVPLYSALVLSVAGPGDEGMLYACDLADADVPAELAVMSACQTGLGRHVSGEGLLGLSWSWFVAGVPSTVASQWSVGDDSTAHLMKVFYAHLKAGDTKAEALRQAELALLQDDATRHPFYWAPFVLVGDDR